MIKHFMVGVSLCLMASACAKDDNNKKKSESNNVIEEQDADVESSAPITGESELCPLCEQSHLWSPGANYQISIYTAPANPPTCHDTSPYSYESTTGRLTYTSEGADTELELAEADRNEMIAALTAVKWTVQEQLENCGQQGGSDSITLSTATTSHSLNSLSCNRSLIFSGEEQLEALLRRLTNSDC